LFCSATVLWRWTSAVEYVPSKKSTLSLLISLSARLAAVSWLVGVVEQRQLDQQLLAADVHPAGPVISSSARS